jgi:uncharacterized protein
MAWLQRKNEKSHLPDDGSRCSLTGMDLPARFGGHLDPAIGRAAGKGLKIVTEKAKPTKPETAERGAQSGLTTEEAVGFFLRKNPDFLDQFLDDNPDALLKIRPRESSESEGGIDLRHVLLERLRDEVTHLKDQQRGIISASRANLTIQNRIHSAALHLLDADSFKHLIDGIGSDLPAMLDLDVAALVVERSSSTTEVQVSAPGIRVVPPNYVDTLLEDQEIILQAESVGDELLYGPAGRQVRSQALVRLNVSSHTPPCMLALGSREPDMFQDGMRTDLTAFLARVMERCIRQWLDLPE